MILYELRTFRAYAERAHIEHPRIYGSEETAKAILGNLDDLIASTSDQYTPTPHGEAAAWLCDIHRSLLELAAAEPKISLSVMYQEIAHTITILLTGERVRDGAVRGHQTRRNRSL